MIDRKKFFAELKKEELFRAFKQAQVNGISAILDRWEKVSYSDPRWLAYMFATAYHETARTMWPVEEKGSGRDADHNGMDDYLQKYDSRTDLGNTGAMDGDGILFKGRGLVQITGKDNYFKFSKLLNIPLVKQPELALELKNATEILFIGMLNGYFTGRRLDNYFNATTCDWKAARKIINGMDRAELISTYAQKFYRAIQNS